MSRWCFRERRFFIGRYLNYKVYINWSMLLSGAMDRKKQIPADGANGWEIFSVRTVRIKRNMGLYGLAATAL